MPMPDRSLCGRAEQRARWSRPLFHPTHLYLWFARFRSGKSHNVEGRTVAEVPDVDSSAVRTAREQLIRNNGRVAGVRAKAPDSRCRVLIR